MSTNDLLTNVSSCTEFINQYLNTELVDIKESFINGLKTYAEFVDKINVINRVLLDATSSDEVRLMKIKMKENFQSLKHYHHCNLRSLIGRMSHFNESLKKRADAIKKSISQTDQLFIEEHSISDFVSWVIGIQASQDNLYLEMNYTMYSILEISDLYVEAN